METNAFGFCEAFAGAYLDSFIEKRLNKRKTRMLVLSKATYWLLGFARKIPEIRMLSFVMHLRKLTYEEPMAQC